MFKCSLPASLSLTNRKASRVARKEQLQRQKEATIELQKRISANDQSEKIFYYIKDEMDQARRDTSTLYCKC